MPERRDFLDAIRAQPGEDAPRLIFADWLDENGECERAALIRFQLAGGHASPTPARARLMLPDDLAASPALGPFAPVRERMRGGFLELCCASTPHEFAAAEQFLRTEVLAEWRHTSLEHLRAGPVPAVVALCDRLDVRAGAGGFGPLGEWAEHLRARSLSVQAAHGCERPFRCAEPFPRVEALQLVGRHGDAEHEFALIRACPALRRIDLEPGFWAGGASAIRAAGVSLGGVRDLGLNLSGRIERDFFAKLGVERLETLRLVQNREVLDTLDDLPGVQYLNRLELPNAEALGEVARRVPNLEELTTTIGPGESEGLLRRELWPKLERLTLSERGIWGSTGVSGLDELAAGDLLPDLRHLRASGLTEGVVRLVARLARAGALKLESLDLAGLDLNPQKVAALAGLDAPLETLSVRCDPETPMTAKAVNELARAGWTRTIRAINLGELSVPAWKAAVRHFGPRCDAYWQGDTPP